MIQFIHNYHYHLGNIHTNVKDIIHVKPGCKSFIIKVPLLFIIFHILLPLHRASDIRDSRI